MRRLTSRLTSVEKSILPLPRNKYTKNEACSVFGRVSSCLRYFNEIIILNVILAGFGTAVPLSLNPALTMFLFQVFRRLVNIRNRDASKLGSPSPGESFFGAAISNAIATTALYPLLLAKTLLQMQRQEAKGSGNEGEVEKRSTFTIWKKAYEKHGWSGLYQGLEAQIIKGFVNQGLAMMVKSRYV